MPSYVSEILTRIEKRVTQEQSDQIWKRALSGYALWRTTLVERGLIPPQYGVHLADTYAEYTQIVEERYAQLRSQGVEFDRNTVLRPYWHSLGIDVLNPSPEGVQAFYADPAGLYARVVAYETGGNLAGFILGALQGKLRGCISEREYAVPYGKALGLSNGSPRVFDHGAGPLGTALMLATLGCSVCAFDFPLPHREALLTAFNIACPDLTLLARTMIDTAAMFEKCEQWPGYPYHWVISQDVLEHCIDPVAELRMLNKILVPGGFLTLGTFYNSCGGKDPQHLDKHELYQQTDIWFAEVDKCGFRLFEKDERGVEKVWVKVADI